MKTTHILPVILLAFGLFPDPARALDPGTVVGSGVGAIAGAVIGDSVGGRHGAIVGSGIGGAVGAVVGQSVGDVHYRPVYGGHRHVHVPTRIVEYHYYPEPRGYARGHHKHRHHWRHHHHRHGWRR